MHACLDFYLSSAAPAQTKIPIFRSPRRKPLLHDVATFPPVHQRIVLLFSSHQKKKIIGKPRNGRTGSSTNSTDENFPIGMIVGQKRALADATRDLFSCASDNALQETTAVSDNVNPPVHCPLPRRSLGLQSPFSPFSLDFLLFTSPSIWTDLLTTSCLARNIHYEYFRMVKARERV